MGSTAERLAGLRRRLPAGAGAALTFDDGPDPVATPPLLACLAELDVRATFFLVGYRVERHPELVRAIDAAGHAIGSHTYAHRMGWRGGRRALRDDILRGRRVLEGVLGRRVVLFRPPYGYVDTAIAATVRTAGLAAWAWSVDPEDWQGTATTASIAAGTAAAADGDVVLLHDGSELPANMAAFDRRPTVAAVPAIVERLRGAGIEPALLR